MRITKRWTRSARTSVLTCVESPARTRSSPPLSDQYPDLRFDTLGMYYEMLGIARLPVEADALILPDARLLVASIFSAQLRFGTSVRPVARATGNVSVFADQLRYLKIIIIAFRGRRRLINTAFDDPRFIKISFTADEYNLYIDHDAALYRDDWSGQIEYRFRTPTHRRSLQLSVMQYPDLLRSRRNPRWRITNGCNGAGELACLKW